MPRKKKEIVNELENLNVQDAADIHDLETDDIVMAEMSEAEAAAATEMLKEMDERKRIDASKRKKRDLYRSDDFSSADDEDLEDLITEEDIRYENYQKLNQSLISGSMLKGEVVKCVRRNRDSNTPEMPTAIVRMENDDYFEIKIPFTDFLPKDRLPEEIRGETAADKLNYMDLLINMRTGAKINFVVRKLDESTGEVIASRTMAMSKLIRDKWFHRDRQGRFDEAYLGKDIVGRVVYVERSRMCVEAMGIEKSLDISEVSWQRYSDLRTAPLKLTKDKVTNATYTRAYRPGDSILLRVTGLLRTFRDAEGNIYHENEIAGKRVRPNGIAVKLSAKAVTQNPDEKYYNKFAIGEKVQAEITHVDENGIFCKLAGLRSGKIMFSPDNNDIPQVGSICQVRITRMKEEGYQINCEIVQNYR